MFRKKTKEYTAVKQNEQADLYKACSDDALQLIRIFVKKLKVINENILNEMQINCANLTEEESKIVNLNLAKTYDRNNDVITGISNILERNS